MRHRLPQNLVAAARVEDRGDWLATVPASVARMSQLWSIDVGEPFEPGGRTAWVAPVRDHAGNDLVLKLAWRHHEAQHEGDGLRAWDGAGTVRLHADAEVDNETMALLLERCVPGTTLARRPEDEQDEVVAGLLRRLWIEPPPDHPFKPLQTMCAAWADEFERKQAEGRVDIDAGLTRDGIGLFRSLPSTADRSVLLCTDLHAENVLAARRERWLVIDPKPFVGDPTYDSLQHMLNCDQRLRDDPHGLVHRMADLLDLDRDRLLLWLFARCVQESPEWPGLADVARRIAPA